MIHQLERAEYDSSPQNEHHEKTPLPEISHCHSFHSLYDHCHELTWFDIYNIDEFWMEIKVHYQFQNDLTLQNKRSKREIVSHKTIRGALNNNLIKGVAHHIACPTILYLSSPLANYSFNPLVIIGEYILGQSHLVGVIGNEINSCYPDKNVMYVSTSDFIQEYDGSIKKNKRNKLKKSCLSTDVLIIQHIELLSGKSATQQIMTEIVNHFIQNEKQIILTSEMPLTELADINPQLLSRFKSGLTIELSMPAFEMRIAIIKNIMSNNNVKITEDIITYIARNNLLNTEELYEFCHSLKNESFNKQEITFTLAKTLIEKLKMK